MKHKKNWLKTSSRQQQQNCFQKIWECKNCLFLLHEFGNYVSCCVKLRIMFLVAWNHEMIFSWAVWMAYFYCMKLNYNFFWLENMKKIKKICSVFKTFILLLLISKNLVSLSFLDHRNYGSNRFNYKLLRCSII